MAARHRPALHQRVDFMLRQSQRRDVRVTDVVATVHHGPLVHAEAAEVGGALAGGEKHLAHAGEFGAHVVRHGAEVALNDAIGSHVHGRVEAFARRCAVFERLVRRRVPRLELPRRVRVVLEEEVVHRMRFAARPTFTPRTRPRLHTIIVCRRARLPLCGAQNRQSISGSIVSSTTLPFTSFT